jgi:hypothetical protein
MIKERVVNLTKYDVYHVISASMFTKTGLEAYVIEDSQELSSEIDYRDRIIPVFRSVDKVVGLPEARLGTWYIVSQEVFNTLPERRDLLLPTSVEKMGKDIKSCLSFRTH